MSLCKDKFFRRPAVPVRTTEKGCWELISEIRRFRMSPVSNLSGGMSVRRSTLWMLSSYMLSLRGIGPYCLRNETHRLIL